MAKRYKGINQLSPGDKILVALMIIVPTALVVGLVWIPAIMSVWLSFTNWDGLGSFSDAHFIGTKNYTDVVSIYPPFWPAIQHNLIWLAVMFLFATPMGMFIAVLIDREVRFTRFYQTAFYMPVSYTHLDVYKRQVFGPVGMPQSTAQTVARRDDRSRTSAGPPRLTRTG